MDPPGDGQRGQKRSFPDISVGTATEALSEGNERSFGSVPGLRRFADQFYPQTLSQPDPEATVRDAIRSCTRFPNQGAIPFTYSGSHQQQNVQLDGSGFNYPYTAASASGPSSLGFSNRSDLNPFNYPQAAQLDRFPHQLPPSLLEYRRQSHYQLPTQIAGQSSGPGLAISNFNNSNLPNLLQRNPHITDYIAQARQHEQDIRAIYEQYPPVQLPPSEVVHSGLPNQLRTAACVLPYQAAQNNLQRAIPRVPGYSDARSESYDDNDTQPTNSRCKIVYVPEDEHQINPYQRFARKQLEFFEADNLDCETGAQGRNKPIQLGQLGIRCIHCATLPPKAKAKAAAYYPSRLDVLYQAAQNIVNVHLPSLCESIPDDIRNELIGLDHKRSRVGGGKRYWSDKAKEQGVVDTENHGLRFSDNLP